MTVIRKLIRDLIADEIPITTRPAKVKSVEGKTCTVIFVDDDVELPDVRLSASTGSDDNWRLNPKVNSSVLVTIIDNDEHNAFVGLADEMESFGVTIEGIDFNITKDGIVMNGGELGGLIKAEELKTQLGKSDSYLSTLKVATKAIATALDALVPGTSVAFETAMTGKSVGDYNSITNEKVKH